MLLQIFSGSSLLLGIYLAITNFITQTTIPYSQTTNFHLGCYDPSYTNNHSSQLQLRLAQIHATIRQNISLNFYNSKVLTPSFDANITKTAKIFQAFIAQHYRQRGNSNYNLNYYNELRLAKQKYDKCKGQIMIEQADCVVSWEEVSQVGKKIQTSKDSLGLLISEKEKQERILSAPLYQIPSVEEEQKSQKDYAIKIKGLLNSLRLSDQQLSQLKITRSKHRTEIQSISRLINGLEDILHDCTDNEDMIVYCNTVTDEVLKIQKSVPRIAITELEARINRKMKIIAAIEANIKKSLKFPDQTEVSRLQIELRIQKNQLKLLEFQIQNFQTKEQSRCSLCSKQRIEELRRNISALSSSKLKFISDQRQLLIVIEQKQRQHSVLNSQIQKAIQQKQELTSNQFCVDEQCKINKQAELKQRARRLNEIKKQIIDWEFKIDTANLQHRRKITSMAKFITEIDEIESCLRKKEYFEKLSQKQPPVGELEGIRNLKNKISQHLHEF